MLKEYVYILECNNGSYYTGSTVDLDFRIQQHQNGLGANHTKKRLPIKLIYFEEFERMMKLFTEKNKYKDGVEKRKKL